MMVLREAGEADLAAVLPLMQQLRPHLTSLGDFVERWRRMSAAGYRLLVLWEGDTPSALGGFRVQESLIHGKFLYVDDLVTDATQRGTGLGARLMEALKVETQKLGCAKLVLDTALDNVLGHRFYYRHGLLAMALRFNIPIAEGVIVSCGNTSVSA